MAAYARHLRHQVPVIAGLAETALTALWQRVPGARTPEAPRAPGPEIRRILSPRPAALIRDYAGHVGADPEAYRGTVPPHLFPQWSFGLAGKTLRGLPYPLARALNGGFRLEVHRPMPASEPIDVAVRLESVEEGERRVRLRQRVRSGTASAPDAQVAYVDIVIPRGGGGGRRREPARVPEGARPLERWDLSPDAGRAFAQLTGDVNPVHWLPPYARAFGFENTILHGFSSGARSMEAIARAHFAGDTHRLSVFEAAFTRPLVLPNEVGIFESDGGRVAVGDHPGERAYLVGSYERNLPSLGSD